MSTTWSSTIQNHLFAILIRRLPLHPLLPSQTTFTIGPPTKLTLAEVQIDVEKLNVPNINVRNAYIEKIEVELKSDGVIFICSNVDVVISPKLQFDLGVESMENMMESVVNLVVSEWGDEVKEEEEELLKNIWKSDAIITNKNDDNDNNDNNSDSDNSDNNIYNDNSDNKNKHINGVSGTAINGVLGYAMDYALSKIKVKLDSIHVRILADPIVSVMDIEKVEFETDSGERICVIENIVCGLVKPLCYDGEKTNSDDIGKKSHKTDSNDNLNPEQNIEEQKGNDSNSDNEFDDQLMATSFMAESKEDIGRSLLESAMFSNTGTVYMSAKSEFYDAQSNFINNSSPLTETNKDIDKEKISYLCTVDEITFSCEGLNPIENVKIEVGSINSTLAPFPEFASSFLDLLIRFNQQEFLRKSKTDNGKTNRASNGNRALLQNFNISEINISLTSALSSKGLFLQKDSIRFVTRDINLQQRSPTFYLGSIMTMEIIRAENELLMQFVDAKSISATTDIRFEIQSDNSVQTTSFICSKPLVFNIDVDSIETVMSFINRLDIVWPRLDKLNISNLKKNTTTYSNQRERIEDEDKKKRSELLFKSAGIKGKIMLSKSDSDYIFIEINPMTFDPVKGLFDLDLVKLSNNESDLLTFKNINYINHIHNPVKIKGYDNNTQKECTHNAEKIINIEQVEFCASLKEILRLKSLLFNLLSIFTMKEIVKDKKVQSFRKVRMASSFLFKPQFLKLFCAVESVDIRIYQINKKFGSLVGNLNNFGFSLFQDGLIASHISKLGFTRVFDGVKEPFLSVANKWENSPMIFMKYKKNLSIFFKNLEVDYYGKWLTMFEQNDEVDKFEKNECEIEIQNMIINKLPKKPSLEIFVSLMDICIGLSPVHLKSKSMFVLNKGSSEIVFYNDGSTTSQSTIDSLSVLLIDDFRNIEGNGKKNIRLQNNNGLPPNWTLMSVLKNQGFIHIGTCTTVLVKFTVNSIESLLSEGGSGEYKPMVKISFDIEKLKIGLCSDSAQCLIQLLKDLKQPVYFSFDDKYKCTTKEFDVFKDIDRTFYSDKGQLVNEVEVLNQEQTELNLTNFEEPLNIIENFYDKINDCSIKGDSGTGSNTTNQQTASSGEFSFYSDHFDQRQVRKNDNIIPVGIYIGVSKISLLLYDGYDWQDTRTQITEAAKRVAKKAKEVIDEYKVRESQRENEILQNVPKKDEEERTIDDEIVEETLYDSIYLGMRAKNDPLVMCKNINEEMGYSDSSDDGETPTYPLSLEASQIGQQQTQKNKTIDLGTKWKPLKLKRSKNHKVAVELDEIDVNFWVTSNNEPHLKEKPQVFNTNENVDDSEIVNKIGIRINRFTIFDNVPTSSWNMFIGYLREAGEREIGKSMIAMNIDLVRPVDRLAAIEMILNVSILPLRLYVDQDTLDFITRFSEFKDDRFIVPVAEPEEMFLQKVKVDAVLIKLDYKPKKVDYAGIRSGHTNEFMNFFILDESKMILNQVKLYGVPGFSRLHSLLNGYWTPDIKRNQLGGVLAGIAPVKSIVNISSGFKELVSVPVKEYQKDGRVMRSLQMGATVFGKTTGGELLKFGAKLAAGTQIILENAEELLGGNGSSTRRTNNSGNKMQDKDRDIQKKGKNRGRRRRSSTNSFGDEGEEDYHKYYYKSNEMEDAIVSDNDIDDFYDDDNVQEDQIDSDSDAKVVSLYSNQPETLNEGLKVAYGSLQRNIGTAKDALYSASVRASESESPQGAAIELAKATPILIIRPMIATTEAISKTLLGGVNNLDPEEKKKSEEKYKKI